MEPTTTTPVTIQTVGVERARIHVAATIGECELTAKVNVTSSGAESVEEGKVRKDGNDVGDFFCYGAANFGVTCTVEADRETRRRMTEAVEDFVEAAMNREYIVGTQGE